MKFAHPTVLWFLLALFIPIIIHLYHFRKHKTLYFSSLIFIKKVEDTQRTTNKLKHLLILISRLLAFAFLIIAFAQPFIPLKNNQKNGIPVISIYLDNSFSMGAKGVDGELFSMAKEKIRKVIKTADEKQSFIFSTNDFKGIEQHLLSKNEALNAIENCQQSPISISFDKVLQWEAKNIERIKTTEQPISFVQHLYFTDFQKNGFKQPKTIANGIDYYYPIQLKSNKTDNLYIDSVWFTSPIHTYQENSELHIRVQNKGIKAFKNIRIQLDLNGQTKELLIDVNANSFAETSVTFIESKKGFNYGKASVFDKQLFWDDDFYFSYQVKSNTTILVLNDEGAASTLSKALRLEKQNQVTESSASAFVGETLKKVDLIVLNGVNQIPSGMKDKLVRHLKMGGALAMFPGSSYEASSWNTFLSAIDMPNITGNIVEGNFIQKISYNDPFFDGMFEKKIEKLRIPSTSSVARTNGNALALKLITLQNGQALFLKSTHYTACFLFTGLLNDNSDFVKQTFYPSILLRIGQLSQIQQPLYYQIGHFFKHPVMRNHQNQNSIKLISEEQEMIPKWIEEDQMSYLYLSGEERIHSIKANNFEIVDQSPIGIMSLNYDRKESNIEVLSKSEIETYFTNCGVKQLNFIEDDSDHQGSLIEIKKPKAFWKLAILLCLIFVVTEMVLIKFWK